MSNATNEAEAWAREHVHLFTTDHHKNGLTWIARIKSEGLVFEGRATGSAPKRDALRKRATDAAVSDYLDFIERSDPATRAPRLDDAPGRTGLGDLLPPPAAEPEDREHEVE